MLRLLSYNIRYGGVGRESELAAVINASKPDLVVLQEATHPDVVESIAARTGMAVWGARRGYSSAFISKVPISEYKWHAPRGLRRAFLQIDPEGLDVRIFGVHLSAVHSNWTERRRLGELRQLLASVSPYKDIFHVVAGDFNTLAPGELLEHRRLPARLRFAAWATGGRVRYKTIQMMIDNGYVDGYRSIHDDRGYTFPTWDPHVRLDFVFLPAEFADRLSACDVISHTPGADIAKASDHFPLSANISI